MSIAKNAIWGPPDYSPELTVTDWMELIRDETIFQPASLEVVQKLLACGGIASCVTLSRIFGKTPNFYNTHSWQLGKRIFLRTGCPVYLYHEKISYWPILYYGREAKAHEEGSYLWRIREELADAMSTLESPEIRLSLDKTH